MSLVGQRKPLDRRFVLTCTGFSQPNVRWAPRPDLLPSPQKVPFNEKLLSNSFFFFIFILFVIFPFFFFFFRCVCLTAMETNDFGRTDESRGAGKRKKKWPHGITNIPTRSDSGIGRRLRTRKQNKRMDKLKHEVQRCARSLVRSEAAFVRRQGRAFTSIHARIQHEINIQRVNTWLTVRYVREPLLLSIVSKYFLNSFLLVEHCLQNAIERATAKRRILWFCCCCCLVFLSSGDMRRIKSQQGSKNV